MKASGQNCDNSIDFAWCEISLLQFSVQAKVFETSCMTAHSFARMFNALLERKG